jgi:Signal peptidase, peptidase S26
MLRRAVLAASWLPVLVIANDSLGGVVRVPPDYDGSLPPGSFLWVSRLRAGAMPARGELVALTSPECRSDRLLRRVVALGGDLVRPRAESDGRRLVVVPAGSIWVECDLDTSVAATDHVRDSNEFGPVSASLVSGCVRYAAAAGHQFGFVAPNTRAQAGGRVITPTRKYG